VTVAYDRGARRVVDHSVHVTSTFADSTVPDPAIAALVERYRAEVREIAERPIATLTAPIGRGSRGDEWAMGDLIADAQRWATGSQIAVMNPGGVRAELPAGAVSYADVFAVQPFQNVLVTLTLTGREVERLLEAAVADRIGHVSGLTFSFDPTRPEGERVREATLDGGEAVIADGEPVSPDATYTVTVNNFMAAGGDAYGFLLDVAEPLNTGLIDSDVLADYLTEGEQPVRYEPGARITRLAPWPAPGSE
jgi:5'-nucleotidase